ncbi:26S proteasome regulatory subunit N9 [Klebsormidium nitens]|uniref:26S proteasome regulatory subunit N9 n=1 Tax=Klebsormidium nitens TaxID=105231 RepID=A0A1Y1IL68_KLENI|nr:26S proteasome regulatory subunit N9 [Klebsormidium nitens]|eukprot:GAQ91610.1 26S proteasome regulatory subunit N9 [Klebsormidium nitens]
MAPLKFLEDQQVAHPELAEWYQQFGDLYQRKLWHQLTVKLEQFVSLAALQSGDGLIQLYHNFIADFETKINLLKLAQFAVVVSRQYREKDAAIAYLEQIVEKLRQTKQARVEEPVLYVKMQIAKLKLQGGEDKATKDLLEEGKGTLESMADVDPSVHASVYWVSSQYHKSRQDFAEFYRSALQYLSYTSVDTLSEDFKLNFSVDLSLAALLGENIYNFGELLAHPIMKVLESNKGAEWLFQIVHAFNAGDLSKYDALCNQYAKQLNAQPALVANERRLREKITILSLLELVFSRPSEDRTISLAEIAERTKLPIDGVEFLLMKTLSVHLIEGVIDQVDGTVRVSWVQPRVLAVTQISGLRDRLDSWLTKVHSTLLSIETEAPDLIAVS